MDESNQPVDKFPFSLRHFFEGALCREEVVSGCLAMLLEGSQQFRKQFFTLLQDEQLIRLSDHPSWKIDVEQNEIDVFMSCENTIVVIENKVTEASLSKGQLLRYYLEQRSRTPNARILVVMLAPRRVGRNEVSLVNQSGTLLHSDCACHVTWEDVLKLSDALTDPFASWICEVLSLTANAMAQIRERRYKFEGDRAVLSELIDELLRRINRVTTIRIAPDKRQRTQEVYSCKNSCTMAVGFEFDCHAETDYEVSGITQVDGSLLVMLRAYFRLSGDGKKCAPAADAWRQLRSNPTTAVPNVGHFVLQPNESYLWVHEWRGSSEELLIRMLEIWSSVEQFARSHGLVHDLNQLDN